MTAAEEATARAFSRFLEKISLNAGRNTKVDGYAGSIKNFVDADRGLRKYVLFPPYVHGSYSYGTAVRPKSGALEYDLDMILPMNKEFFERYGPDDALAYVRGRLATNYWDVSQGNKCVRINNSDGFHADIVPAHAPKGNTGPVSIVDRKAGEYITSHPVAVTDWVAERNRRTCNRFSATIRILKRWRDEKFGAQTRPKSLLLTVLAGRSIERAVASDGDWQDLFASPATSMGEFVEATAIVVQENLSTNGAHIPVPGTNHNLGDRWSREARGAFNKRLDYFVNAAGTANASRTGRAAVKRWGRLLGSDFPISA